MANQTRLMTFEQERDEALAKILKFSDDSKTGDLPPEVRLRVIALAAQRMFNMENNLEQPQKKQGFLTKLFTN